MRVSVVGAGPAGCAAGARAAELGGRVCIYEEHEKIGEPVACSAIVSRKGLEACGVPYEAVTFNKLRGAFIHLPGGLVLCVKAGHDVANVFDRAKYDKLCAERAEKAGAMIEVGRRIEPQGMKKLAEAGALIGADGFSSPTAKAFGFPAIKDHVFCYQEDIEGAHFVDETSVHVFVSNSLLPGFFAWAIPLGKERARVGCGVMQGHNPKQALDRLVEKEGTLREILDGARTVSRLGGVIPVCMRKQTAKGRVLLVGDAAGQAKATTGGGIYFGSMCGRLAGEVAAQAKSEKELVAYENLWRTKYGKDLEIHRRMMDFAAGIGDGQLCSYARLAKQFGIERFLSEHGDMDSPGTMLESLRKSGGLLAATVGRLFGTQA
ncbi:MAG: NAD(P)/FAD-dependent oxidoreductase [Candidatus Burarchaeum sp.]|nr:NAD(P)/FAD-dependent oxidoreductase [Candidatus Burarchaeum sp.]MDO8340100.1 NAD(P)/FAD-dependent oxidoreductase [Candidatus Burarchaeum sp.]